MELSSNLLNRGNLGLFFGRVVVVVQAMIFDFFVGQVWEMTAGYGAVLVQDQFAVAQQRAG